MLFFAVVYTVEGFCQAKVGVVWQPLTHYLKETQGWDAVQIAAGLAVLDVPWVIKPLYGMVSDFLPLFGYRRRSYLLLSSLAAVGAFLACTLLAYDDRFDVGRTLREASGPVALNHPHCAKFCVLGGAACSR